MFKKLIEMGKRYPIPLWTIILFLLGGIASTTLTAYKSDSSHLESDIEKNTECIEEIKTKCINFATLEYVSEEISKHESKEDIKFAGIENQLKSQVKKTDEIHDMVKFLYELKMSD